jgi:hypothetical protein
MVGLGVARPQHPNGCKTRISMSDSPKDKPRRTPIRFKTREEFTSRPNYVDSLVCAPDDLDYFVGKYEFTEPVKFECHLNGCKRPHWHGFVIATKDGRETHCGRDCGKREFGVPWENLEADFIREEKADIQRQLVTSTLVERAVRLREALEIQAELSIACAAVKNIVDEINKDPAIARALNNAIASGGRILSKAKVDRAVASASGQKSARANLVSIGSIRGGRCVADYSQAGKSFQWKVVSFLEKLDDASVRLLEAKELEAVAKKLQESRETDRLMREFLEQANLFVSRENLDEILKLQQVLPQSLRISRIFSRLPSLFRD